MRKIRRETGCLKRFSGGTAAPSRGSSRRGRPTVPKGRQVEPPRRRSSRAARRRPRRPRPADRVPAPDPGPLRLSVGARHLAALADEMRLAQAEVYEVATFYAHFDVVKEGEAPPPPLTIRVCDSLTCAIWPAPRRCIADCEARPGSGVRVVRAPCIGRCDRAPVAEVGHRVVDHARRGDGSPTPSPSTATMPRFPTTSDLDAYRGGRRLRDCCDRLRAASRSAEDVIDSPRRARACAGSAAPASRPARKWRSVRARARPAPDGRQWRRGRAGHLQGPALPRDRPAPVAGRHPDRRPCGRGGRASTSTCATNIRDAAHDPGARDRRARGGRLCRRAASHLRRGAGAYICGEESAMIESIEGKRGLPRHRPPFPSPGRPVRPADADQQCRDAVLDPRHPRDAGRTGSTSQGRNGRKGLRSYSVSGRVKDPGVKLAPAGITVRELIDEYCGGMADGPSASRPTCRAAPRAASCRPSMADLPLDFGTLEQHGCFVGSAAVVVLSDQDDIKDVGAQPDALLRGRELRPVHALPGRHARRRCS